MGSFYTNILGITAYVEYHYTPGERPSMYSPGCNADAEIDKIIITQDDDKIRIDPSELPDDLYDDLRNEAIKDAES